MGSNPTPGANKDKHRGVICEGFLEYWYAHMGGEKITEKEIVSSEEKVSVE